MWPQLDRRRIRLCDPVQNGTTPQNGTGTLGATGLGMYIGYDPSLNSFAIQFDTYQNTGYDDPVGAHVAIQSLGTQQNTLDHGSVMGANLGGGPVQIAFADGAMHNATITYDGTTLSLFVDRNFVVSAPVGPEHAVVPGRWRNGVRWLHRSHWQCARKLGYFELDLELNGVVREGHACGRFGDAKRS